MSDQTVRISLTEFDGRPVWRVQVDCVATYTVWADIEDIWDVFRALPLIVWNGYRTYTEWNQ
jgi:hypothetical protein